MKITQKKITKKKKATSYFGAFSRMTMVLLMSMYFVACSSSGVKPTTLLEQSEKNISVAKSHDAGKYAPLALKNSEEYLAKAKTDIKEEEFRKARRNLELSLAKSDYAIAKAKAENSQKTANEISQGLLDLQRESLE